MSEPTVDPTRPPAAPAPAETPKRAEPGRAGKPAWAAGVRTQTRLVSVLGLSCVALFTFGFGAWAAFAPLASAVIAQGVVIAAGENLAVQHLEGGIIERIFVREGEKVSAGQKLLALDPTAAAAQRNRLDKQFVALSARAARLVAERDGLATLAFPPDLAEHARAADMTDRLAEQKAEFDARLMRHSQEQTILGQRVAALRDQMSGMAAQQTAVESQLAEVRDEAGRKKSLLDRGLTNRSEYSELVRTEADLLGQLGQAKATILSAQTQITEAQEQLARLATQRVETAVSDLNDVRGQIADAQEQFGAAQAVLDRILVRAPSDGIIVSMTVNSPGMVVKPSQTILQILPTTELVVQARVAPRDADAVYVGQRARMRFTALNARTTPVLDGEVTYLSADRLINPDDGEPYYVARLSLPAKLPREVELPAIAPGSPVETYISLGDRTFLDYLTRPITDSFSRAFREE